MLLRRTPRAGFQLWILSVALCALGALFWFGVRAALHPGGDGALGPQGALVQRGPLHIAVLARGNLKAADSASLKCELEGKTTILSLVPEGTLVAEGDLVCELDATALVERRFQQRISVNDAEAALVK